MTEFPSGQKTGYLTEIAFPTLTDEHIALLKPLGELRQTSVGDVLFTSGSTGEPKGVECPHRAVVRLVVGNRLTRVRAAYSAVGHDGREFTAQLSLF